MVPTTASPETAAQHRARGPIHAQRHVRIVCIGAGASGLLMAYKLQRHFSNYSLTVYEKNSEVSGTWFENRYPGYVVGFACKSPGRRRFASAVFPPLLPGPTPVRFVGRTLIRRFAAARATCPHTTTHGRSSPSSTGALCTRAPGRFMPTLTILRESTDCTNTSRRGTKSPAQHGTSKRAAMMCKSRTSRAGRLSTTTATSS